MRRYFKYVFIITVVILIAYNPTAYTDTLFLKDGRKIEGFIVEERKDFYLVKILIGSIRVRKENVSEVKRLLLEENYLNFGNQYLLTQNYDAALEQYKKALEVNPGFQPAKKALARTEKLKKEAEEKQRAELESREKELLEKKGRVLSGFGMDLGFVNGKLNVIKAELDSPADVNGIKTWDLIPQIDGQATQEKSLEEILNYLLNICILSLQAK